MQSHLRCSQSFLPGSKGPCVLWIPCHFCPPHVPASDNPRVSNGRRHPHLGEGLELRASHVGFIIAAFQYLKGAYKKAREGLFTRACSDRTRGNGFKLKGGRFRLDIRKKFFTSLPFPRIHLQIRYHICYSLVQIICTVLI